jgi:uncharacterized protein (DUF427 family)
MRTPDDTHPITVEPTESRVTVHAGDKIIADTTNALTLREADYPPVHYIPLADVDATALRPTQKQTYCPFKGDASYYTVDVGNTEIANAIWTYERPYPAVASIAGHVAFYPNKVQISVG